MEVDSDIPGCSMTSSPTTPKKIRMNRGGDMAKSEKPKHRSQKFRTEWQKNH